MSTMTIRAESWDAFKIRTCESLSRSSREKRTGDETNLSYDSVETLLEHYTPKRIALLQQLALTRGGTAHQFSQALGRPEKAVARDLGYLVKLGAVESRAESAMDGEITSFYPVADRYIILCEIQSHLSSEAPPAETRSAA